MTETAFTPVAVGARSWRLVRDFVTDPRGTLRTLEGERAQLYTAWALLAGIVLLNLLVGVLVGRDDPAGRLVEAGRAALLLAVLLPSVLWLVLRFLTGWQGSWRVLHVATVLVMLPLAFGPIPVVGILAAATTLGLTYLILRDVAGQPPLRSVAVWALAVLALGVVAMLLHQAFGGA